IFLMLCLVVLKKLPRINWVFMTSCSVLFIILLIKVLFPPGFLRIRNIPDVENFQHYFNALPLMNPYIPTNWLAQIFMSDNLANLCISLLFTISLIVILFAFAKYTYLWSWQQVHSQPHSLPHNSNAQLPQT